MRAGIDKIVDWSKAAVGLVIKLHETNPDFYKVFGESRANMMGLVVKDRHRSREFIEFLKLLDAAYPAHTAIKLILDNHSAHISKETKAWLAEQPTGQFEFTFTPKHGSWLNLVEGFFFKLARSVLRHIRVASKQELKDRIMAAMDEFNRHPVVHTWSYKLDNAA